MRNYYTAQRAYFSSISCNHPQIEISVTSHINAFKLSNRSLGFHSKLWPTAALELPPSFMLRKRLRTHANLIEVDDLLLKKGGGATKLNGPELEMACVARSLYVFHVFPVFLLYRQPSFSLNQSY